MYVFRDEDKKEKKNIHDGCKQHVKTSIQQELSHLVSS